MKRTLLAVFMVLSVAQLASAQTGVRIFGAQQFVLDDNTFANPKVYLSANNGSMGIDQNGFVTGTFPNASSMLTILAGTKTFGLKIDGGSTWGLDIVNTNNGIRSAGRNFFGDGAGIDDNVFNIGGGNLIINTLPAPALPGPLQNVTYMNGSNQMNMTPGGVNIVTGSGTVGTVPLWTPTGFQLGNSILTQTANTGINVTPGVATTNNVLVVNGVTDATIASLAGNAVWDSRINGDQLVTGVQKIGGSIWLDGNSATHQIVTDAPVNIGSKNGSTVSFVTNNTPRMSINAAGSIDIPTTTAAGAGVITQGGLLFSHSFGSQNYFAGVGAGNLSLTGGQNTGVGFFAMNVNGTGQQNTAVGNSALRNNQSGNLNVAVGLNALQNNVAGNNNTAVGLGALLANTSSSNTAVGFQAGITNNTGSSNTFLGAGADATVNNLTNATAIGSGATVSQSSSIVLGSGERVGIGVQNPGSLLANTNANIQDQGGDGLTGGSIAWQYNNSGYIVGLQNTNVAAVNPHGLLVKTAKTTANTRVFVANSGPGNGTDRFTVQGDGSVLVNGTLRTTMSAAGTTSKTIEAIGNDGTIGNTNVAAQITKGELTVGRRQAGAGTAGGAGVTYSGTAGDGGVSNGPSGIVDINVGAGTFYSSSCDLVAAGPYVINNQYVTTNSIILCQVLNNPDQWAEVTVAISSRAAGSFTLGLIRNYNCTPGVSAAAFSIVKIGYTVINPDR